MQLGPFSLNFGKKKEEQYKLTEDDRKLGHEVRALKKEIKLAQLQGELSKAQNKGNTSKSLLDQIDEAREVVEAIDGPGGEEFEEEGPSDIMQFLTAMQAMKQGQGLPGENVAAGVEGLAKTIPAPSSPPRASPPTPEPQPVVLSKADMQVVDELAKNLPDGLKNLMAQGLISSDYFFAICGALWKKLNRP